MIQNNFEFQKSNHGRPHNEVRPVFLQFDAFGYATSSVLFSIGKTKVLASVSMQDGVPRFLRGQKKGWLTAEYAMLPCATKKRTMRESSQVYKNSRSVEISRLIGRSFRSVVDLVQIGEKTIMIDCDVLQADGGTRVACITAANVALKIAQNRWLKDEIIKVPILKEDIAAISAGFINNQAHLDLDYYLDSNADADFNFVLTRSGKLIEVQGTSEKEPLSFEQFEEIKNLAISGIKQVFNVVDKSFNFKPDQKFNSNKTPIFTLGSRLNSNSV
jgi:ribonuclease PH